MDTYLANSVVLEFFEMEKIILKKNNKLFLYKMMMMKIFRIFRESIESENKNIDLFKIFFCGFFLLWGRF